MCIDALKDAMAQAAVFYYSNVILSYFLAMTK